MKKIITYIIIIIIFPVLLQAQYTGGNGNGDASISFNNAHILIRNIETELPSKYELYQNYPNPFNPLTIIKFLIKEHGFVSLKIFDILGKEIAILVNEDLKAGQYEVSFSGDELPSGIFICKIETDKFQDSKKMILIK